MEHLESRPVPGSGDALRPAAGSEDGAIRVGCREEMNPAE